MPRKDVIRDRAVTSRIAGWSPCGRVEPALRSVKRAHSRRRLHVEQKRAQPVSLNAELARKWVDQPTAAQQVLGLAKRFQKRTSVMADDDLSDLEIVVLCDLLEGPRANLKAHKRAVLDQLVAKRLVEPAKDDPTKFQLSEKAHHLLAEPGVGISGG